MRKQEYIERYGIEGWEHHLAISREWIKKNKQKHNDATIKCRKQKPEYYKNSSKEWNKNNRLLHLKLSGKTFQAFCIESEWELIENYELAKADNFIGWHCHHRLELHPDYSIRFKADSLKKLDLYYNRPARELIFLTHAEHARIHSKARWING